MFSQLAISWELLELIICHVIRSCPRWRLTRARGITKRAESIDWFGQTSLHKFVVLSTPTSASSTFFDSFFYITITFT